MYPRAFEYVAPPSLDEAIKAMSQQGAKVLAGGMSLITFMKLRLVSPDLVVDIGRIPGLDHIEEKGANLVIGALARHHQVANSAAVAKHAAALATAAAWTGDVQVRNRGTTCGSVAHADLAADQPGAVLALNATLVAKSANGTREITAADFFVDALTTALNPDEILTEIRIPVANAKEGSGYEKLGRRGGHTDYAVAGAAAWVRRDNGHIADCRVALTGVSTKPTLALATMTAFRETDGSEKAVVAAAAKAAEGVTIIEDLYGSVEYKRHLATVLAKRALLKAVGASR